MTHINVKTCYLVGGAPTSGKTTYANILAAQHQAVHMSTDNIRSWMKRVTKREDYPNLFHTVGITAEEFYQKHDTADKVVKQEISEGIEVEKGIVALLQSKFPWESLVIEGVAITPNFATRLIKDFPHIKFEVMFLYDDNAQRIEQRISSRGLWGPVESYPKHLQSLEVKWVIVYNQYFKDEAQKHDFNILRVDQISSQSAS